jgi:hypothetical protein
LKKQKEIKIKHFLFRLKPSMPAKRKASFLKTRIYKKKTRTDIAGNWKIADLSLFDSKDNILWESAYKTIVNPKYQKETRKFKNTQKVTAIDYPGEPPIFLIPRQRGKSYKEIEFEDKKLESNNLFFAPISRGFSMQDVSSMTLGPIVGEGLVLVNAAFSKQILVAHLEGGGCLDLRRKNFWRRAKKPHRNIEFINNQLFVNHQLVDMKKWLESNKSIWFSDWNAWRQHIALCSDGGFHWNKGLGDIVCYYHQERYLDFVSWKKQCYITPSYELLPKTKVFRLLQKLHAQDKLPLGLVHPKARNNDKLQAITRENIRQMFDSPTVMCCQPYVVAGRLLGVEV